MRKPTNPDALEALADDRPLAEPTFHSYRELPDDPADSQALFVEMARLQQENGATFFRYTVISPEYPNSPYPNGLWVEGWEVAPWQMSPSHKPAEFAPPITSARAQDGGV